MFNKNSILQGDVTEVIKTLPDGFVHTIVTSSPYYGLRNYGIPPTKWPVVSYKPMTGMMDCVIQPMECCFGDEPTPDAFVAHLVFICRELKRVLRDDGVFWYNIADSYYNYRPGKGQSLNKQTFSKTNQDLPNVCPRRANKMNGLKEKDLFMIPARCALALQADGWTLRQDIVWSKSNPMPESVLDRCTKSHEYIFMLTKSPKYYFNNKNIQEDALTKDNRRPYGSKGAWEIDGRPKDKQHGGTARANKPIGKRNKRSVWSIAVKPYKGAHFATFPITIPETCIKASCPKGGIVFDPFLGSGTTALAARNLGNDYLGIELNPKYIEIAKQRLEDGEKLKTVETKIPEQLELF